MPAKCGQCLEHYIPQGWFGRRCRRDVPNAACYVGHCCDTYVWVLPVGVKALSRFTLSILDLATAAPHEQTAQVLRVYKGMPSNDNLDRMEVTTTESPPDVSAAERRRPAAN